MISIAFKARVRWGFVRVRDLLSRERFAVSRVVETPECSLTLEQPFKPSETLEGKKHNLREAARKINSVTILPGGVFSFWHVVGNPNNPKRFTYGRSLHAGVPVKDYGGGLCQASGIIHHAALMAGLEVCERHNHSVDLYTDETRFAPLGSDATVFFGYKDLRIKNNSEGSIRFSLSIEDSRLVLRLLSVMSLPISDLKFNVRESSEGDKRVEVVNESGMIVSRSIYKPLRDCNGHN